MFIDLCTAEKTYHVNSILTDVLDISYTFGRQVVTSVNNIRNSVSVFVFAAKGIALQNWTGP